LTTFRFSVHVKLLQSYRRAASWTTISGNSFCVFDIWFTVCRVWSYCLTC